MILTILTVGFVCMGCFLMGAMVGQTVVKGEKIQPPTINPMKAYREHEAKREARMEQSKLDTIMRNIEAYDGTASRQEDVPR